MDRNQDIVSKIEETKNQVEKIKLQIQLAHQTRFTDPELSLNTAKEAWHLAKTIADTDLELEGLITICSSFLNSESYQELDKWINLLENRGNEMNRKYALGRANLFHYVFANHYGKTKEAGKFLHQALEYFEDDNNTRGKTTCYISMGNIEFNQGDYDKANEYYQSALNLYPEENNEIVFTLKQNIASVLMMKKEYHKAWTAFQDLLDIIPEYEYGTRSLLLINLGYLSTILGEIPAAIQYYDEVMELKQHTTGEKIHVKASCAKADILINMGKPEEACQVLKAIKADVDNTQNQFLIEKLYRSYLKYYQAKNVNSGLLRFQVELLEMRNKINETMQTSSKPEELQNIISGIDELLLIDKNPR
ncbi:MAG: tetratricopeptide repeat protein [Candidatus Cloacimonetes bacterium]|nr:tetratricopeptide repeat protein [Candidatus Cloacimonadota bacterium]